MRPLKYVVITTTLASAMIFAQSQTNPPATRTDQNPAGADATYSRTFTGSIVSADCAQASILPNSGSFADRASSSNSTTTTAANKDSSASSTSSNRDNKSVYDKQIEVLKHCRVNDKTTAFAVLTDDGSFYKLNEAGNSQVNSQAGSEKEKSKNLKKMRVTVTGTPQGDTLKVQSLTKTDKPFGSA